MKKKQLEVLLYSVVGVLAMFLILVALNFIFGIFKKRIDLTHEKLYTLSDGSKAILKKLDGEVEIRFYATQGEKEIPPQIKNYARHVEDLLAEYRQEAKGKIVIKKLDPKPDSDAEDSARLDGVEGQMLQTGEPLYLGIAVSYVDQKVAVPFLSPDREKLLEYDISRAISKVANPEKPIVGVMTTLPMFGMPMNPMMARMGQQPQESWVIVSELQRDFTVKQVQPTADSIDSDIQVLIVAHPKDITDKSQYAIDQFIMRGGKLIAFLDAHSVVDSQSKPQQNPMMPNFGGGSSLEKLIKAWGLTFDTSKVVADLKFTTRLQQPGRPPQPVAAVLSMTPEGIDRNDVVTSQLDNLLIPFAGAFSGTPVAGLKQTVLLKSTSESQLVESFMAQMGGEQISKDFKASGTEYPIAIRLAGKFKTAFPDGPPAAEKKDEEDKEAKKEEKKDEPQIKESAKETAVILVGDSDLFWDQVCVQVQNIFGQKIVIPRNGNLTLVQNMVEQLGGDINLIKMRSRATLNRPFTVVEAMKAQAEANYRNKIKELETSLQEAQTRLNELQAKKDKNQRMIITPEQQAEIEKAQQKKAATSAELKKLRKDLRRDIDALENKTKWLNIAGMPFAVTLFGLGLAIFKQKRSKAR